MITKAVIPAAGFGTRLLPATKSVPKEMLPIINVPSIELIVNEAVNAGIKDILIIISDTKTAIENHFDHNFKLENELIAKNKQALYKLTIASNNLANIYFIRQKKQQGLGDAILCAESFIGKDQAFAVLLGDDVIYNKKNEKNATRQCIDIYNKTKTAILGCQNVDKNVVDKYGIVAIKNKKNDIMYINDLVEKPSIHDAPSQLAILGRYILTNDIFKFIKKTQKDKSGEIQITNALKLYLQNKHNIAVCEFAGIRYDLGSKIGIVKATIDYALRDQEIKEEILKFIRQKSK